MGNPDSHFKAGHNNGVHLIGHPNVGQFRSQQLATFRAEFGWRTLTADRAPVNGLNPAAFAPPGAIYIWQFRQEFTSSELVQEFGPVTVQGFSISMKRGAFSSGRGVQRYKYTNIGEFPVNDLNNPQSSDR